MTSPPRILLYSHDTFGLGHIRRNRKIADALAGAFDDARIVIATGSSFAASYREQPGVSLTHLPPVTKNGDGSYRSQDPSVPIADTIAQRGLVLRQAAETLQPDLMIADKEPAGLMGELKPILPLLKSYGTKLVLGLREVLDEPGALLSEWEKNRTASIIETFYDAIWAYGPSDFHDPLAGLDLPASIEHMRQFTGYLPFDPGKKEPGLPASLPESFVLVTTGGGGDGNALLKAVFAAAKAGGGFEVPVIVLPGPYLDKTLKQELTSAASQMKNMSLLDFDPESEKLMAAASGVVAMCGYNTFCEVIQLDKPALFVPREKPRREQLIRARRASELGLSQCMTISEAEDPQDFFAAINALSQAAPPSASAYKPDFSAMENIGSMARVLLETSRS